MLERPYSHPLDIRSSHTGAGTGQPWSATRPIYVPHTVQETATKQAHQ
jgi:hypothetical protein